MSDAAPARSRPDAAREEANAVRARSVKGFTPAEMSEIAEFAASGRVTKIPRIINWEPGTLRGAVRTTRMKNRRKDAQGC
jgi:hypothetical protein